MATPNLVLSPPIAISTDIPEHTHTHTCTSFYNMFTSHTQMNSKIPSSPMGVRVGSSRWFFSVDMLLFNMFRYGLHLWFFGLFWVIPPSYLLSYSNASDPNSQTSKLGPLIYLGKAHSFDLKEEYIKLFISSPPMATYKKTPRKWLKKLPYYLIESDLEN